jgi:hypothetical protein
VCNSVAQVFADPMTVYDCTRHIFMYSAAILENQLKFLTMENYQTEATHYVKKQKQ